MVRDQTTRPKHAARQRNGRDGDCFALHFLPLETQNSVPVAATGVVGLIAWSIATAGMGDGEIVAMWASPKRS